jgi:hypothetical protein
MVMKGYSLKPHSWIDTVAAKLNFDSFLGKFNITTAIILESGSYFTVGALAGFMIKRYLRLVLISSFGFFIIVRALDYSGIGSMVFDWTRIKAMTGIGPADTLDSIVRFYILWARTHVRQVISLGTGFLIGIKFS